MRHHLYVTRHQLIRAVGKALYDWGDDEPNSSTGFIARAESEGVADEIIRRFALDGIESSNSFPGTGTGTWDLIHSPRAFRLEDNLIRIIEGKLKSAHAVLETARRVNDLEAITLMEDRIATFERMLRDGAK